MSFNLSGFLLEGALQTEKFLTLLSNLKATNQPLLGMWDSFTDSLVFSLYLLKWLHLI